MPYVKEPFEELDVMNYFMFNKLTTEKDTSENFCRCILRNLLGIEVDKINIQAEKIEFPDNPRKRGVRLDVKIEEVDEIGSVASIYDIEPHRDIEKQYPKKNRYTQALIDKNNLESGERDFNKLPNLFIICITNYDPFGYNQMIYTMKNQCVEVPDLVYNDGVRILYFNTTGTKGGTDSLKQFLTYLEDSTEANAVDEATLEVKSYVSTIKSKSDIGGKYMTVGDLIDKIVEEAVAEKDNALAEKDVVITEKDEALAEKDKTLAEKDAEIKRLQEELHQLQHSSQESL